MSEEPQFPPIPDIGEILSRKDRFIEKKTAVLKCKECQNKYERPFKIGDFTFKKLDDEECEKCHSSKSLYIEEIYSEWIDPKKKSK
ncbi:MAG: hypothetical protein ACFFA8_02845 [Promethearchaeota archaeon]